MPQPIVCNPPLPTSHAALHAGRLQDARRRPEGGPHSCACTRQLLYQHGMASHYNDTTFMLPTLLLTSSCHLRPLPGCALPAQRGRCRRAGRCHRRVQGSRRQGVRQELQGAGLAGAGKQCRVLAWLVLASSGPFSDDQQPFWAVSPVLAIAVAKSVASLPHACPHSSSTLRRWPLAAGTSGWSARLPWRSMAWTSPW